MGNVRRLCIITAILALYISPTAHSQTTARALSLDDCIRLAESAPSSVTQARQQAEIANLGVKEARSAFLPQAQANNGFVYNSPLLYNSPLQSFVALNGVREYSFLLATSEDIDISGRLRADAQRAKADLQAARVGQTISRRDLKRQVTAAYYRLLLSRHIAQSLTDSINEAESFENRTKVLLDNGEASNADLVKATAATASFRRGKDEADLEAKLANQDLASFWTTNVNDSLQISDVFQSAPDQNQPQGQDDGANPKPYMNRPEFQQFQAQTQSFLAQARSIRASLYPQANVSFQFGMDSTVFQAQDHGYAFFVNLTVPIFDWKHTLNNSREFRLRADQVQTQQSMAERAFSREYESARARVDSARDQIALADRQVSLGEEDLQLSRIRFEGGEGPAIDVVAAQSGLAQARISYFTAVSNYWNARADLEVATGR